MAPTLSDLEKRCLAVINSCKTQEQLDVAQRYVELYFKRTSDITGFRLLINSLNSKLDFLNK
jgi:hypothetical protein